MVSGLISAAGGGGGGVATGSDAGCMGTEKDAARLEKLQVCFITYRLTSDSCSISFAAADGAAASRGKVQESCRLRGGMVSHSCLFY